MKKRIKNTIVLLYLGLSCCAQEITTSGFKFTTIAILKSTYKHDCDCQSRVVSNKMFNFDIVEINMHNYGLNTINIVIPCPESFGDNFFSKSSKYKIEFYDNCTDMSEDSGICDEDIPKRKRYNIRFWVHSIVKIDTMPPVGASKKLK